jgi:hypothetical protein
MLTSGCTESGVGPSPVAHTAAEKITEVNALAYSYGKGLRLVTVSAMEVSPDGTADVWNYQYVDSTLPPTAYWFHSTSGMVAFDSTTPAGVGAGIIRHTWFDSDSAMSIAERNGGIQVRTSHPACTISASLGEPVIPNSSTTWWITYRGIGGAAVSLILGINAVTGEITLRYP